MPKLNRMFKIGFFYSVVSHHRHNQDTTFHVRGRISMSKSEPEKSDDQTPASASQMNLMLEYAKALAWPLLIVGLLAVYRPPLGRLVDVVINKVESASEVKLFAFELKDVTKELGLPDLGADLTGLSSTAIEYLMKLPNDESSRLLTDRQGEPNAPIFKLPKQSELDTLAELEAAKLIVFATPLREYLRASNKIE
jgi:hypothetical protein